MRRGFLSLKGLVQDQLRHYHLEQGVQAARAVAVWDGVAGPLVAAVTRADIVRDGILYVHTRSSAWSQELAMLREQLVAGVNKELGADLVKDIRFQVKRFTRAAAVPEAPRPLRALTDDDRRALAALSARLTGDTAPWIGDMAARQMKRGDRAGTCSRCGGPADPDQPVCPFCR